MSIYDQELRARILRDGPDAAAEWYIKCTAADNTIDEQNLSDLEKKLWRDLCEGFRQLCRSMVN
jgi:hypothetical protein